MAVETAEAVETAKAAEAFWAVVETVAVAASPAGAERRAPAPGQDIPCSAAPDLG